MKDCSEILKRKNVEDTGGVDDKRKTALDKEKPRSELERMKMHLDDEYSIENLVFADMEYAEEFKQLQSRMYYDSLHQESMST